MKKVRVLYSLFCLFFQCIGMQHTEHKFYPNFHISNYYMYQIKGEEICNIWEENRKEMEVYFIRLNNNDLIKATKNRTNKCTCSIKPSGSEKAYAICASTFYTVKQLYTKRMEEITIQQNLPFKYSSSEDSSNEKKEIGEWTFIGYQKK